MEVHAGQGKMSEVGIRCWLQTTLEPQMRQTQSIHARAGSDHVADGEYERDRAAHVPLGWFSGLSSKINQVEPFRLQ